MDFFNSQFNQGSRPSTATSSFSFPSSTSEVFIRPSTSAGIRPVTSSGRRPLTANSGSHGFDVSQESNESLLNRERDTDDLLRILNQDQAEKETRAILYAEQGEHEKLFALLNSSSTSISTCRGLNGYTLLHHAAARGHARIVLDLMRLRTIDVNSVNDQGETPLHLAVYHNHILIVDQLLDFGAQINIQNKEGESPLFYAVRKSLTPIIRLLLSRDASIELINNYDETVEDYIESIEIKQTIDDYKEEIKKRNEKKLILLRDNKLKNNTKYNLDIIEKKKNILTYDELLIIFQFLSVSDVLRAACVCSKWHRVSEAEIIWKNLGVRKWELALNNSLGFKQTATASFFRPRSSNNNRKSSQNTSSTNSLRSSSSSPRYSSNSNTILRSSSSTITFP